MIPRSRILFSVLGLIVAMCGQAPSAYAEWLQFPLW